MTTVRKKIINAIPVEIVEIDGKFHYILDLEEGKRQSKKGFYSESKALNTAEKAIEYYLYVGH